MGLSLEKGAKISLTKEAPGLDNIMVGLGWEVRTTDGSAFDLDASALLIGANGKVRSDADFIFYNQLSASNGSVVHQGDNRTGEGDGDDEKIHVGLSALDADVSKVVIAVSIHNTPGENHTFGQVRDAFVRLVDETNNNEVLRFDLSEDSSTETAMIFAEIYRHGGEWKFNAVGQGYNDGLAGIARDFGVNV